MRHLFSPKQIIRSIILSQLIKEGPLHGYALSTTIEEKFGWKPSQTAIYNTLKTIETEKLVTSEERVENGRVQKIYSITDTGQEDVNSTKDEMFFNMSKRLSQMFSIMQDISEIPCLEDQLDNSNESDLKRHRTGKKMQLLPAFVFKLIHVAPEKTHEILDNTLKSLEDLAKVHKISIEKYKAKLEKLHENSED